MVRESGDHISETETVVCKVSIAGLGVAQICSWGTLYYSFPQLAVAIEGDLGWLKSDLYGALTLGLLLSALFAIPIGKIVDQGYGRFVMTSGSIASGMLLMAGSQINTLLAFYLVITGIGFLHATTLYDAAFSVIAKNVSTGDTKRYITSLTLWGGFAATIFIPLIEMGLEQWGWRVVMVLLGLVNLVLCAVIYSTLPGKADCQKNSVLLGQSIKSKTKPIQGVKWALRQPIFWVLLVCFSLFAGVTTAFKFHLYPLLIEKGLSVSDVVVIVAVLGPAQVVGRVVLYFFSDRLNMAKLGVSISLMLPIVFAAIAFLPTNFWILVSFAIAFGAATGTMTIIKGVAVPEFLTPSSYGAISGAMNMPVKIISALAPSIAAFLWYGTNNYDSLLYTLIALGAGVAFFFATASRMRKSNEPISN